MPESIWTSRPPDLYGRRDRDRLATVLWGVRVLFGGIASASRWKPSRVRPVRRMQSAVVTNRELVAPDVVSLTLADPDGGLLPSWTPGAHIDVALPSGRR
ncbi:MAG TPA: oxidoreductase, partial [Mycobacterium sp.]|nr:oxidoreductase [Mycobacterium sp.]